MTRRLVESIKTDPFIDAAFVSYLISREDWLDVARRQAVMYNKIGDIGEDTITFRTYKDEVKQFVIRTFKPVYERGLEKYMQEIGDEKARRAWRAVITLLASQQLINEIGVGLEKFLLEEFLPAEYIKLEDILPVLDDLIREKTKQKGLSAAVAVKNILRKNNEETIVKLAPLFWWNNLIMESEVIEGVLKYHYIVSNRSLIADFVKSVEGYLSRVAEHKADYDYMEQEVLKGLLSRCAELRGQYINKLQNAIIFIKLWRRSAKNPEAWSWFLKNEVLTYALSIYLTEIQTLLGLNEIKLNILTLLAPKQGIYSGPASVLSTLILMSPIFMQYVIEARRDATVTPADIIVALLRIARSRGMTKDFGVDIYTLVEEIIKFWDEKGLLHRLKNYVGDKITPEALYRKNALVISLSLIINAGIGAHVYTSKRPELLLPPRMDGFDSIYIRLERFQSILKSIWSMVT